jgi:hypothetical protein
MHWAVAVEIATSNISDKKVQTKAEKYFTLLELKKFSSTVHCY